MLKEKFKLKVKHIKHIKVNIKNRIMISDRIIQNERSSSTFEFHSTLLM